MKAARALRIFGRFAGRAAKPLIRLGTRRETVPLTTILRTRSLLPGRDPLVPTYRQARRSRHAISDATLARVFGSTELGTWTIGPRTIDLLEEEIKSLRPSQVLELGSGVSTVCLAHFMNKYHDELKGPCVVSIEQSEDQAARTRSMLEDLGLGDHAIILVRDLVDQTIAGRQARCYDLSSIPLTHSADLVFIDGPAGEPGVRLHTLPLVMPYCSSRSRFLMDDALRDGGLEIARSWNAFPGVIVEGIRIQETGVLVGWVEGPGSRQPIA